MNKSIFTIIFLVIALLILFKIQSFIKNNKPEPVNPIENPGEGVMCTMDAMLCPDGSYVGRSGPNCEFKCPGISENNATTTVTLHINEPYTMASTTINVLSVLEESRCPSNVVCIQAGRILLSMSIISPLGSSNPQVEAGKTINTETLAITLDQALPYPMSPNTISPQDYEFTFSINKK